MDNTALVPQANKQLTKQPVTPTVWQMISAIAPAVYRSRLFGVTSVEAAMVIMLKGYELGMGLTAAFEMINVIQGRPALSPRGALALILQSGELEHMTVQDQPDRCTVRMKRRNGLEYELTFTMEDAKRTGQVKPGSGWETYPTNMLRWRAIGFVADVVFPDIIGGTKRADEFGAAIDEEGNVVEGNWTMAENNPPTAAQAGNTHNANTAEAPKLEDLVSRYGAEAILEVNGGKIPASEEELIAIAAALEAANG